jgi:hypothetical protein
MSEQNYDELVTKGLLAAFGAKCKKMFKYNPVHTYNSSSARWIKISTSLEWFYGFDDLYINIQGVTKDNNQEKKTINSNFYIKHIEYNLE